MTAPKVKKLRRLVEHALVEFIRVVPLDGVLARDHIETAISLIPSSDPELEELLLAVRYALCFDGSLTDALTDGTVDEPVLRHFLFALEVAVSAQLTGEPRRLLPFAGGFRGGEIPGYAR